MGQTIGEVNINLRMSLAQFKQDTADGAAASSRATKQIADDTSENVAKARESLQLMAEDFGVTIPRGIRTMIATLPGVGDALSAAFDSVAIIAVVGVIAEVISKLQDYSAQIAKISQAWDDLGNESAGNLRQLDQQLLGLQIQLDNLAGDHVEALKDTLKQIDGQTFGNLVSQLKTIQTATDKILTEAADSAHGPIVAGIVASWSAVGNAISQLTPAFVSKLFTSSDQAAIQNMKEGFDGLTSSIQRLADVGNYAGALQLVTDGIARLQAALAKGGQDQALRDSLNGELGQLQDIAQTLTKVSQAGDMFKQIAQTEELNRAQAQAQADLNEQLETLKKLESETANLSTAGDGRYSKEEQQTMNLIQAWKNYAAQLDAQGINSGNAAAAIEVLESKLASLRTQADITIDKLTGLTAADKKVVDEFVTMATSKIQLPAFGDTAQEQRYQAALLAINQQMADGKLTAEEYAEQVQNLKFQFGEGGAATGVKQFFQEFQQGGQEAKATFDLLKTAVDGFETNLATQLATGKANWQDFFDSIDEMLLKSSFNTLLQAALSGANDSDFFSSLGGGSLFGSGGLFGAGHAGGGPVDAGVLYPIGERGPEWFKPSVPGTIIPNDGMKSTAKTTQVIQQTIHINGVQDVDSFKKSMPQVQAEMYRSAASAHGRYAR